MDDNVTAQVLSELFVSAVTAEDVGEILLLDTLVAHEYDFKFCNEVTKDPEKVS